MSNVLNHVYEKYIDSGIGWIGEIPSHWRVGKVKNEFYSTKTIVGDAVEEYQRLALTLNGVIKRSKEDSNGLQPEKFETYQIVKENELIFKLIDLQNVQTSRVGRSPYDGLISPAYIVLHSKENKDTSYAEYYFLTMWLWEIFNSLGDNGVRSSINASGLLNLPFLLVPDKERSKIVDYLTHEVDKIDDLIRDAKESILDLIELKKSMIFECTTNSLDNNSKWKSCGLQFINHIPEHWDERKMLSILSMRVVDGAHESPELVESGVPYISATAIENGKINFDKMRGYISEEYCDLCDKRYKPQRDDILIIKLGGSTGQVAIVDTDRRFNIWVPLAALRCNDEALPQYVYYVFQSDYMIKQMELSWTYGTQETLGIKTIERLRIILPPKKEQIRIVEYLDNKIDNINELIEEKEKLVSDLEIYRKTIIYEVVTGKRKVV